MLDLHEVDVSVLVVQEDAVFWIAPCENKVETAGRFNCEEIMRQFIILSKALHICKCTVLILAGFIERNFNPPS